MIAVSAGVGGFAPERESGDVVTPFELVANAYDSTGQPYASARQTLELSWPEAADDDAPRYVDALSRLDVEPGSYEIRVAAAGGEAERPASVYAYVTVPDYATTPFSLSHVVLGAGPETDVVPPGFFQGVLPIAPTTQRAFQPAGGVTAFMQVYQGTARTDALEPVGVRARIVDTQGTTVRDQALVLGPEEFAVGRAASVRLELPVQNLRAGEYLFRLEAMMGERVAGRALRFRVE